MISPGNTDLRPGELINEERYHQLREEFGKDLGTFEALMGGEAVRLMLERLDLVSESVRVREEMKDSASEAKRKKLAKRLRVSRILERDRP